MTADREDQGAATGPVVALRVSRYEHSTDPQATGMRGVMLDAQSGFPSGNVFSIDFPTVFVSDNGDVEVGDLLVPVSRAAAWFRAVADYLDSSRVQSCLRFGRTGGQPPQCSTYQTRRTGRCWPSCVADCEVRRLRELLRQVSPA